MLIGAALYSNWPTPRAMLSLILNHGVFLLLHFLLFIVLLWSPNPGTLNPTYVTSAWLLTVEIFVYQSEIVWGQDRIGLCADFRSWRPTLSISINSERPKLNTPLSLHSLKCLLFSPRSLKAAHCRVWMAFALYHSLPTPSGLLSTFRTQMVGFISHSVKQVIPSWKDFQSNTYWSLTKAHYGYFLF